MSKKIQAGFTLLELMVVISIIGFLMTILVPNISVAQTRAKEAGVKAIVHTVQSDLEGYQMDTGAYPVGTRISVAELSSVLGGKQYKNSFTGKNYEPGDTAGQIVYEYNETDGSYVLTAYKRDGRTVLQVLTNT
jgi:type II secretion system protein G